jgi:hypothetical protein
MLLVALAASQHPGGLGLTRLARAIGSPVSSVQAAVHALLTTDLLRRVDSAPPRYRANTERPSSVAVLDLAIALADPVHALAAVVRSNPTIQVGWVDAGGFIVGHTPGSSAASAAFDAAIDRLHRHHATVPPILRLGMPELAQLVHADRMLRRRLETAVMLVGERHWLRAAGGHHPGAVWRTADGEATAVAARMPPIDLASPRTTPTTPTGFAHGRSEPRSSGVRAGAVCTPR